MSQREASPRIATDLSKQPELGLAIHFVVDSAGLQMFPKPGCCETTIACQRYIERYEKRATDERRLAAE